MVSQSGWEECHGANLSSGWGHFCSAIPLSVMCKGQIRCPPATGDSTFPTYHHQGVGDCCYLHLCGGESCVSVLLCIRQNAKISAQKLQTVWNNSEDSAWSSLGNICTAYSAGNRNRRALLALETATSDGRGVIKSRGTKAKTASSKPQKRSFASKLWKERWISVLIEERCYALAASDLWAK